MGKSINGKITNYHLKFPGIIQTIEVGKIKDLGLNIIQRLVKWRHVFAMCTFAMLARNGLLEDATRQDFDVAS